MLLTSTTATAFMSARATSSVLPSGDTVSALGVVVCGASGNSAVEMSSSGSPENVLKTLTTELFALATNRRLPSSDSAIALGCSSVSSVIVSRRGLTAYARTWWPPQSETNTVCPSGDTTQV